MRCYHSISKILLYGALVFIGAKCAELPCHSCEELLTNETGLTPRCTNRTEINCNDTEYFCGITVLHLNNTGTLGYKEMCVHHLLCINTTAACSQPDCFLHCCHQQLCNSYDKAKKKWNYNLASFIKKHTKTELPVTEQPTVTTEPSKVTSDVLHTRKRNIRKTTPSRRETTPSRRKTTPSSASMLMSCKILLLPLFVVILKDII